MKPDQAVRLSRCVAVLGLGACALLVSAELAVAQPIALNPPPSTPQVGLLEAAARTRDVGTPVPIVPIPEPSTVLLLGTGFVGVSALAWWRHRRG